MTQKQVVSSKTTPIGHQPQIELFPVTETEVDGVQMGVLSNGTPYLTARGLARMCGVDHSAIIRLAGNWADECSKPRGQKILALLRVQGHPGDSLFVQTRGRSGNEHAYTDAVCMAILEYYAFEATQGSNEVALYSYRILARSSFRDFIYKKCGYDPAQQLPQAWKVLHERILLNDQIPSDYFSVFRESADIFVHMIRSGCPCDSHTVLDGSIGIAWGKYWVTKGLEAKYGARLKHSHFYPEWFPQAAANPIEAWIYPILALGEFKQWLYASYVSSALPSYLKRKVSEGVVERTQVSAMLAAVTKPSLPGQKSLR